MTEAGLNPIYAAAENLSALYDSVKGFDASWRLTQEFSDPGSSVAAAISCSAADSFENLLSALGLEILATQFRIAHLAADCGDFGGYHEHWDEYEAPGPADSFEVSNEQINAARAAIEEFEVGDQVRLVSTATYGPESDPTVTGAGGGAPEVGQTYFVNHDYEDGDYDIGTEDTREYNSRFFAGVVNGRHLALVTEKN